VIRPFVTFVINLFSEQWQIEQNFKRTVEALEEAADRGTVLAITPECVLHRYGFSGDKELLHKRMLVDGDIAQV
jgi:predicted amidohydrolase